MVILSTFVENFVIDGKNASLWIKNYVYYQAELRIPSS